MKKYDVRSLSARQACLFAIAYLVQAWLTMVGLGVVGVHASFGETVVFWVLTHFTLKLNK